MKIASARIPKFRRVDTTSGGSLGQPKNGKTYPNFGRNALFTIQKWRLVQPIRFVQLFAKIEGNHVLYTQRMQMLLLSL